MTTKQVGNKNLNIYHFKDDELWKGKDLEVEILAIARTRDNAKQNIINSKFCYVVKKQ